MEWKDSAILALAHHPILDTKRLRLRPMTLEDLSDYHEYTSDQEVLKYDYYPHQSLAESELSLVKWNLSHPLGRFGIELRENGKLIGNASITLQDAEIVVIGYTLNKDYWRQGFGTELVNALCGLAFGEVAAQAVQARVVSENKASIALLEKCHFKRISENPKATNSRVESCVSYDYERRSNHI